MENFRLGLYQKDKIVLIQTCVCSDHIKVHVQLLLNVEW